jgi:hypothetical protein
MLLALFLLSLCVSVPVVAQATYTSQLTGVVSDSSGAVIPGAKVTLTDEGTNIAANSITNGSGIYLFTGVRPGAYTIRVESLGLAPQERKSLTLAVSQSATLNFTMRPSTATEVVDVTVQAPLLDTGNASLGTDVTNEYVRDIPLSNRSMFGLVFLAGGVTETAGQGTNDSYPSGTNFVSNGQRNATAEIRLDGALTSAPEQGEGATTNVYYQPSVEIVQEFKVENNSFSSEYGNNGGTVVNIVLKQGGNRFHGSGWWFGQRSALDANEFFNEASGGSKPDHARDQYGFAIGGPIKKNKTFFFVDFEALRQNDPFNIDAFVPTALERTGDFRNSLQPIFNPFDVTNGVRNNFTIPNLIDPALIDPLGQKIINMYPQPTDPNAAPGDFNFHQSVLNKNTGHQFDIKIDHNFSDRSHLSGRYSDLHADNNIPTIFGNGDWGCCGDGFSSTTDVHNASLEHNFTITPNVVWTNRFALDRAVAPVNEDYPNLNTVFDQPGDAILAQANHLTRFPTIQMDNNASSLFNQCCTDTGFAHTLYSYSSSLSWARGRQIWKFGGEQRLFFNNFFQPGNPTGQFHFTQGVTEQIVNGGDDTQGNSFASLLLGYGDPDDSFLDTNGAVANKSKETAFYFQDDWKVSSKLTVNLGLRYEWSTPYSERNDQIQFSNFTGDTGIAVPITVTDPNNPSVTLLSRTGNLIGTTDFPTSGRRNVPVDRNNWAPRVGFAYAVGSNTVVRGGAGIYYGLNVATNYQSPGPAFGGSNAIQFTKDDFETRHATLADPFPDGFAAPQGQTYGKLAMWGLDNGNTLGTTSARNAEIYQWNLGVQHLFPGGITIGADYSGSQSRHLPFSSGSRTGNKNFLPSSIRNQVVSDYNDCLATDPNPADDCASPSDALSEQVSNPFQPLFQGANAIFNLPSSIYNDPTIPLINLLRPFPQFDGQFSALTALAASASYNSLQVRFQKRPSHYVSFEGNYTYAKAMDDSSAGANSFITDALSNGRRPQELDNLKAERSISASDATHRMVLATIVNLPIGRGLWIGGGMNRALDTIIGGWSVSTILTFQSGTPIHIGLNSPQLADGAQRPNVICPQVSSGISYHQAAMNGLSGNGNPSIFNEACFAEPGDQVAGNAPRYFSNLRTDGIHNADLSLSKEISIREGMRLQIRGEFFNFTNTPRFGLPGTSLGDSQFGQVTSTLNSPRHMQFGARFQF